jgi:hypothetical protein
MSSKPDCITWRSSATKTKTKQVKKKEIKEKQGNQNPVCT